MVLLVLAGLGSGCSKQLDPLSSDQKSTLQSTLQSAGRAYSAGRSRTTHVLPDPTLAARDSARGQDEMANDLYLCETELRHAEPGSITQGWQRFEGPRTYLSLEVNGGDCPVSLDFEIDVQANPDTTHWISAITYAYQVNDASYRALNDVDQISLNGNTRIEQAWSSNAHTVIDLSGQLHSQQNGSAFYEISGTIDGNGQGFDPTRSKGEITWHLEFASFIAELKQQRDGEAIHYYLNGDEIDENTFQSYFSEGGEPFYYSMSPERIK